MDVDRLRQEIVLLHEELRIKDARMGQNPPQRRPHYSPVERLAILELRSARAWLRAQIAERFLTPVPRSPDGFTRSASASHVASRRLN